MNATSILTFVPYLPKIHLKWLILLWKYEGFGLVKWKLGIPSVSIVPSLWLDIYKDIATLNLHGYTVQSQNNQWKL